MSEKLNDTQAKDLMFGFGEDDSTEEEEQSTDEAGEGKEQEGIEQQTEDEPEDVDLENDEELKELKKQNKKVDSAFAKLRREAQLHQNKVKELDNYFAARYAKDYNINSAEEFLAFMEKQDQEAAAKQYREKQQELIDQGISQEDLENLIKNHPDFRALKEKAERAEANNTIREQLTELSQKDKRIQAIEDINKILTPEKQVKFWDMYQKKGLSLKEAYLLVNEDELTESIKKAGAQSAINKINSKNHMKPSKGSADIDADIELSREELAVWKSLKPGWTEAQIREYRKKNA